MTTFTRRTLMQGGTALAATGALAGSGLAEWAKAWAQAAPWKPEKGAQLSLLRWKYFVQSEDDAFVAAARRLHQGDRRQGQRHAGIVRGYSAEGLGGGEYQRRPGPVLGPVLAAAPVPAEMRRRHRRRRLSRQEVRRLGADRGRLRQERQQVDRHSDLLRRQHVELPHLGVEEGGLLQVPGDDRRVPGIRQGDEAQQHARRHGARSRHRRRQLLGALVPVGARRQRGRRQGQGHPQLARDRQVARIRQAAF